MKTTGFKEFLVLGISLILGLSALGYLLGKSLLEFKEYERSVSVKGLAEREVAADIALWPLQYTAASNDLSDLYAKLENDANRTLGFLQENGFSSEEITVAPPSIVDKLAQQYGPDNVEFRYTATQTITVYSKQVDQVRNSISKLADLGKEGIVFNGNNYESRTEYLFTGLNDVKPEMIEEATKKAREVAIRFAEDSDSVLGKIKRARQGQFSIEDRDSNTPYIKKVRVVSTVEYYLSD